MVEVLPLIKSSQGVCNGCLGGKHPERKYNVGKGSVQFEHGVFNNVMYVPSLVANLSYAYQMTHTGSLERVVFEPKIDEISYIYTRKLIAKGDANHASKVYEFSIFFSYSHQSSLLNHANERSKIWHERFYHLNFK